MVWLVIYRHQIALKDKLLGRVEVDESYFGAKRHRGYHGKLKRGRGTLKQPVFGVFERDGCHKRYLVLGEPRPALPPANSPPR